MLTNRRTVLYAGFSVLMLAGTLVVSGCAGSGGPTGVPSGTPPGAPKMAGRPAGMPLVAGRPLGTATAPVVKPPSETAVLPDAAKPKSDKPDAGTDVPGAPKPPSGNAPVDDAKDKTSMLSADNK